MAEFVVDKVIDADIDAAWKVLADFGALTWAPGIERCETEGPEGVGQVRKVQAGPVQIVEKLEHFDPAAKSLSYSIVEGPLPAENYLATVSLEAASDGKTRVQWGAKFDTPALDEDAAKAVAGGVEGSYSAMVDALGTAASS